jgi:hypothetical protein
MHKASQANQRGASILEHTSSRSFFHMDIQRLAYIGSLVYELVIPFCFLISLRFVWRSGLFEWDH